jgi:hypothetical protein
MAEVGAPLIVVWQACGRDEGGGRRRGQQGARPRGEGQQGAPMELPVAASVLSVPTLELLCCLCSC